MFECNKYKSIYIIAIFIAIIIKKYSIVLLVNFGLYHTINIYLLNNWEDLLTCYANESLLIKCTKHITCILVPVPSGEINMSITIS